MRCRHPLHVARAKVAAISHMILMAHASVEHVRDGFEAAMRVRWESGDIVIGIIGVELVEHQERVHL